MAKLTSYLVAGGLLAVGAAWMGSGVLVAGGKGAGSGETPIAAVVSGAKAELTPEQQALVTEAEAKAAAAADAKKKADAAAEEAAKAQSTANASTTAELQKELTAKAEEARVAADAAKKAADDAAAKAKAAEEESAKVREQLDATKTIAERNAASGNGSDAKPRSVRIAINEASMMPIEVPLRGHTQAKASVSVVAQTSGIVQTVAVKKGQSVNAGDLLCTLDQGARKLAVDQAQAAVDQAQTAFDSNASLIKKGLAAENTGLSTQSALAGAKTALEQAQLELARTEIKTDIPGVIADPLVTVGSMLAAGQPCATVVQLDPMLFQASVPESKIGYARLGLLADVTTVTGAKAQGKVTYIAPSADDATRSFPVEIELPNADGSIRDGITAEAVVNVGSAQVHILPQSALTLDDNGVLGIRTVEEGSKVAFHAVDIIKDTRDGVWVIGLPEKINLITVGQEYVQPGQVVDAKTENGESASL